MTISNRTFGVEIECFNLPHPEVVLHYFRKAGIRAYDEDYLPFRRLKEFSYWKMQEDHSISGKGFRQEFASRILKGPAGLEEVRKVCRVLQSLGAHVNKSCGLHVHVGTHGLNGEDLRKMLERYATWEESIDEFVLAARRTNKNCYSRSVKKDLTKFILNIKCPTTHTRKLRRMSKRTFAELVDSGHRKKLDFDSFLEQQTIEFRHHHGTIDPVEVTNWIKFCLNFTETSRRMTRRGQTRRDTGPLMGLDSRTRQHFLLQAEKHR